MKDRKNPNSNRQQGGAGSQGHWQQSQQSQQSQQPSRNDKMRKGSDRKDSSSHRSQQR